MLKIEKKFTLHCFFENKMQFYLIILVNTKTTIPLRVPLVVDIYLDTSLLGIYPPLFTSPLGNNC